MHTDPRPRHLALLLVLSLAALPAAHGLPSADVASVTGLVEGCFIAPIEPGEATSRQHCVKAPAGTTLRELLMGAPSPFDSWTEETSITLGTHYKDFYLGGASFQWWGSSACSSTVSYRGDLPSDWVNTVSSSTLGSSSGCGWFYHYDDGLPEDTYCTASHKCDTNQLTYYLMNDMTDRVRFTA